MTSIVARSCIEIPRRGTVTDEDAAPRPLAAYRSEHAYVLIGCPGSGKSTEFAAECRAMGDSAHLVTARDFLAPCGGGNAGRREGTIFIDGLDEIRAGSSGSRAPLDEILWRLDRLGSPRFRISCRDADWMSRIDQIRPGAASSISDIRILRLEQLTDADTFDILTANAGIDDARAFMSRAEEMGLADLLLDPLSLDLLTEAAGRGGKWPQSRLETFESACRQMAAETRGAHVPVGISVSPEQVLGAAGHLCAIQLLSGSVGFSAEGSAAGADHIALTGDSRLSSALHRHALSTRLFRGTDNGGSLPVHRHIAEFLAGRYLAALIEGGLSEKRVVSLMADADGVVVAELRGLSGWLAALSEGARGHLIEADPVGVSLYGDIRGFSAGHKRGLLESLSRRARRDGPGEGSLRSLGPIACPDMESSLREMLTGPGRDADHQSAALFTLKVLNHGTPLPDLASNLMDIVRGDWGPSVRRSALDAFIRNSAEGQDRARDLSKLLEDVIRGRVADDDSELAGTLLIQLYPAVVGPSRVWDYLSAGPHSGPDGRHMRFWTEILLRRSTDEDICVLLDGLSGRPGRPRHAPGNPDLNSLFRRLLARGLKAWGDGLSPERLAGWLGAGSPGLPERLASDGATTCELRTWLDEHPDARKAALLAGLLGCPDDGSFTRRAEAIRDSVGGYGSAPLPELGPWSLDRSAELAERAPHVAEHLLRLAVESFRLRPDRGDLSLPRLQESTRGNLRLEKVLADLLEDGASTGAAEVPQEAGKWREEDRRIRHQWTHQVRSSQGPLRENRAAPALLFELGRAYFGYRGAGGWNLTPELRLRHLLGGDHDLAEAALVGLRESIWRADVPGVDEIIRQRSESRMPHLGPALLAGMEEIHRAKPERLDHLTEFQIRTVLACRFCMSLGRTADDGWYRRLLHSRPGLVAEVLVQCVAPMLRAGADQVPDLYDLAHSEVHSQAARHSSLPLLRAFPVRCRREHIESLDNLLWAALQHAERRPLEKIIVSKLSRRSMDPAQRVHWLAAGFVSSPDAFGSSLEDYASGQDGRVRQLAAFLAPHRPMHLLIDEFPATTLKLLVGLIGASAGPAAQDGPALRWGDAPVFHASELVAQLIHRLESMPGEEATLAIDDLLSDGTLLHWRKQLERARDARRRTLRIAAYRHQQVAQVHRTLDDLAPANAADLTALVLDRLTGIAARMGPMGSDGRKRFWNVDSDGWPESPRHVGACRDVLIEDMRMLLPGGVDCQPEGGCATGRADIRVAHRGLSVPVAVRRSNHPHIWSDLRTLLAAARAGGPVTTGHGVYLVLWVGDGAVIPPPFGRVPTTALELQERLRDLLMDEQPQQVSVIVIDVSVPSRAHANQPHALLPVAASQHPERAVGPPSR